MPYRGPDAYVPKRPDESEGADLFEFDAGRYGSAAVVRWLGRQPGISLQLHYLLRRDPLYSPARRTQVAALLQYAIGGDLFSAVADQRQGHYRWPVSNRDGERTHPVAGQRRRRLSRAV